VGHEPLIHEVSRSHNDTPQSVGRLWMSDQFVAETNQGSVFKKARIFRNYLLIEWSI
jgi:hypothetical protein